MPMLAMKHQFYYNIPLPQFETGEHANEDSAYCKFLTVENPLYRCMAEYFLAWFQH
jgi:hypothetical protein